MDAIMSSKNRAVPKPVVNEHEMDGAISLKAMDSCGHACRMKSLNTVSPMIACRICALWFHHACVGLPDGGTGNQSLVGSYVCVECSTALMPRTAERRGRKRSHVEAIDTFFAKVDEHFVHLRQQLTTMAADDDEDERDVLAAAPPRVKLEARRTSARGRNVASYSSGGVGASILNEFRRQDDADVLPFQFGAVRSRPGSKVKYSRSNREWSRRSRESSTSSVSSRHPLYLSSTGAVYGSNRSFVDTARPDPWKRHRSSIRSRSPLRYRSRDRSTSSEDSLNDDDLYERLRFDRRRDHYSPATKRPRHHHNHRDDHFFHAVDEEVSFRRRHQRASRPRARQHQFGDTPFLKGFGNFNDDYPNEDYSSDEHTDIGFPAPYRQPMRAFPSNNRFSDCHTSILSGFKSNLSNSAVDLEINELSNVKHQTDNSTNEPVMVHLNDSSDECNASVERAMKDEESIEDDFFLYCYECRSSHLGDCPVHGPMIRIHDSIVCKDDPQKARNSLPPGFSIRKSSLPGAGLGIWADVDVDRGVVIGPYGGKIAYNSHDNCDSDYCWHIVQTLRPSYCVDGKDVASSNWLRYINCANDFSQQNLTAFQFRGHIFYQAIKPIVAGCELLVWYGREFAKVLGLDSKSSEFNRRRCKRTYVEKRARPSVATNLRKRPTATLTDKKTARKTPTSPTIRRRTRKSADRSLVSAPRQSKRPAEKRLNQRNRKDGMRSKRPPVLVSKSLRCLRCKRSFCNAYGVRRHIAEVHERKDRLRLKKVLFIGRKPGHLKPTNSRVGFSKRPAVTKSKTRQ